MALIKLTAFIDNISGSVRGSVFASNKGGHYVRGKGKPTNPNTNFQANVRGIFAGISSAWRSLTQAQRDAWNGIAPDFPYQNRLGDSKILSGKALFQKLNNNLGTIGLPLLETPVSPQSTPSVLDAKVFWSPTQDQLKVEYAETNAQNLSDRIVVFATPALSVGVSNFTNELRVITTLGAQDLVPGGGVDVTSAYEARFGTPVQGTKIGFAFKIVNGETGQASPETKADVIIV